MTLYEYYMIFPDGEKQEIARPLSIGTLFDMNGRPLRVPLPTNKMIVYQVESKRTIEERGIVQTFYQLYQLNANELLDYV